jgi:hypothetical protein
MASAWDGATARVSGHRLRRRTGTVFNYAEDAHLRDDLPCGCALCETCDNDAGGSATAVDGNPVGTPLASDATHYLVPDATSIAEYVDFLEMRDAAKNIILLQSEARPCTAGETPGSPNDCETCTTIDGGVCDCSRTSTACTRPSSPRVTNARRVDGSPHRPRKKNSRETQLCR